DILRLCRADANVRRRVGRDQVQRRVAESVRRPAGRDDGYEVGFRVVGEAADLAVGQRLADNTPGCVVGVMRGAAERIGDAIQVAGVVVTEARCPRVWSAALAGAGQATMTIVCQAGGQQAAELGQCYPALRVDTAQLPPDEGRRFRVLARSREI